MNLRSQRDPALSGKKRLAYFVGSGATARAYLLADDGFLRGSRRLLHGRREVGTLNFPATPAYEYPYTTRPVLPGCLSCHASGVNVIAGTQNRFASPPFREGGVACERCHGPGEAHIADPRTPMINPARLAPARRDSVCAQCHLNGEVRVMRAGATWQTYKPGDLLRDSVVAFVRAGAAPGMRVTSHFEKLAQSACQRASGDKLWCGTCHDPHSVPAPAQRVAFFRAKCMTCHSATACAAPRAVRDARRDDCIACHMPKGSVTDAQHVVYTDHSIPRRPRTALGPPAGDPELAPFGDTLASPRDIALAYAILAVRDRSAALQSRARELLEECEKTSPNDSEVLLYLAEIYRKNGLDDRAAPLYERAMKLDPSQVTGVGRIGRRLLRPRPVQGSDPVVAGRSLEEFRPRPRRNESGDGAVADRRRAHRRSYAP